MESADERIGLTLLQKSINCVSLLSAQMVVFFHIQRKYKLFEFNHPGASPRVVFVYLSVALTTGKYTLIKSDIASLAENIPLIERK